MANVNQMNTAQIAQKLGELKALIQKVDCETLRKDLALHSEAMLKKLFNHSIKRHREAASVKGLGSPTAPKKHRPLTAIPSLADAAIRQQASNFHGKNEKSD